MAAIYAAGAGLCMAAVFLVIFINSTRRYALGKSFVWGEELPVFLAIYGIVFGIAWAYMQDRHIRFSVLRDLLPETLSRYLDILIDMTMMAIGGLLAWSAYLLMMKRGAVEASGLVKAARALRDATGIESLAIFGQLYPYHFALALGGVMLSLAALTRLALRLSGETMANET